jgi:hypothetical protein
MEQEQPEKSNEISMEPYPEEEEGFFQEYQNVFQKNKENQESYTSPKRVKQSSYFGVESENVLYSRKNT